MASSSGIFWIESLSHIKSFGVALPEISLEVILSISKTFDKSALIVLKKSPLFTKYSVIFNHVFTMC